MKLPSANLYKVPSTSICDIPNSVSFLISLVAKVQKIYQAYFLLYVFNSFSNLDVISSTLGCLFTSAR
mgnify:CR=1 FL=1